MKNALIGYTGFVGSTLCKQVCFDELFRSINIGDIVGRDYDTVVCAGAPAEKWLANKNPINDRKKIEGLIGYLSTITCKRFILISTVDVFKSPIGISEDAQVDEVGLHAYGLHRRCLEKFVEQKFPNHLIVRLPGLVGPGLRKNIIFDFLNSNNIEAIDSRGVFQFYPMVNLWYDIETVLAEEIKLVHLTAAPIRVADVTAKGFGLEFENTLECSPAKYDLRTRYAGLFEVEGPYQYSVRETIQAVRFYAQSEARTLTKN